MGYIRHHAIIVTSWNSDKLRQAHAKAVEIFGPSDVTPIIEANINGYCTFFVGPDGSKEGWTESIDGDERRLRFIGYLNQQRYDDQSSWLKWVVVQYGDDEGVARIERHTDEHVSEVIRY